MVIDGLKMIEYLYLAGQDTLERIVRISARNSFAWRFSYVDSYRLYTFKQRHCISLSDCLYDVTTGHKPYSAAKLIKASDDILHV